MIGKQMLCILRLLDCCDLQSSEIAPTILLAHCFSFNCKIQIDAQPMFVKFSGAITKFSIIWHYIGQQLSPTVPHTKVWAGGPIGCCRARSRGPPSTRKKLELSSARLHNEWEWHRVPIRAFQCGFCSMPHADCKHNTCVIQKFARHSCGKFWRSALSWHVESIPQTPNFRYLCADYGQRPQRSRTTKIQAS